MKRFPSIKKNSDFQTIYRTAKSYANRQLVMYVRKTDGGQSRIGISVSKKVGNSVVRHHLARLVRESFRLNRDTLEEGLDIIVVARAAAKDSDYKTIERAFMHLCGLHNIKKESKWEYDQQNFRFDEKASYINDTRIPDLFIPVENKNSLYLHAYVFPIRHWGTSKVWRVKRYMVSLQEDPSLPSLCRRRLWSSSVESSIRR